MSEMLMIMKVKKKKSSGEVVSETSNTFIAAIKIQHHIKFSEYIKKASYLL